MSEPRTVAASPYRDSTTPVEMPKSVRERAVDVFVAGMRPLRFVLLAAGAYLACYTAVLCGTWIARHQPTPEPCEETVAVLSSTSAEHKHEHHCYRGARVAITEAHTDVVAHCVCPGGSP